MGPTIDELNKILEIKNNIKQSIINKGVEITDNTKFADYPSKIDNIPDRYNDGYGNGYNDGYSNGYDEGSANGGGADPIYEVMWNAITNNNTDYSYLFHMYDGTTLDVSNLDTSNVTYMSDMFNTCQSLTSIDVSNFDTGNVIDMSEMFYDCRLLTSIDVSNFNTSKVTNMYAMFRNCWGLTSLDVSNFNTSNVNDMRYMFANCYKLTSLDLSNFDTSNVTSMAYMFSNCFNLISLDMTNCDISKCTSGISISSMFGSSSSTGCSKLTDFKAPKNISGNIVVSYSPLLTHDSLMSIINNLATVTSSNTLTLGATNKAKLTADEIAIATNKGWTVK